MSIMRSLLALPLRTAMRTPSQASTHAVRAYSNSKTSSLPSNRRSFEPITMTYHQYETARKAAAKFNNGEMAALVDRVAKGTSSGTDRMSFITNYGFKGAYTPHHVETSARRVQAVLRGHQIEVSFVNNVCRIVTVAVSNYPLKES